MTDAEKLAVYERVMEIVNDQLALEQHYRDIDRSENAIQMSQMRAFCEIEKFVSGRDW